MTILGHAKRPNPKCQVCPNLNPLESIFYKNFKKVRAKFSKKKMINFSVKTLKTREFLHNHWHFSTNPRSKRKTIEELRSNYVPNLDPTYINSIKRKVKFLIFKVWRIFLFTNWKFFDLLIYSQNTLILNDSIGILSWLEKKDIIWRVSKR